MDKEKYITIPKNETGIKEYNALIEDSENLLTFNLPEDEYSILDEYRIFDIINERYGLMIDIYESETVTAKQLQEAYGEIISKKGVWQEAVDLAIAYGTCMFRDF